MIQLRPYQNDCIKAVLKKQQKSNKLVVVLPTGGGKTIVFSHLIKQRQHLGKSLILAHREELLTQAQDKLQKVEPTLSSAIEQADNRAGDEQVIIASVPTIGRKNSKRLLKLNPKEFKTVIIDECFVAGTLIDGKPIEALKEGDLVWSYNEKTKDISKQPITHIFKQKPTALLELLLSNGQTIVCTPNHPFYVDDKWKAAKQLVKNDVLTDITSCVSFSISETLPTLPRSSNILYDPFTSPQGKRLLLRSLQKSILSPRIFKNHGSNQPQIRLRKNEKEQSHEQSFNRRKNEAKANRQNIFKSWRQWVYDKTTTSIMGGVEPINELLRMRYSYAPRMGTVSFSSHLLQGRYWNTRIQASNRNRRQNTQTQKMEVLRPSQNRSTQRIRVEGIKIHQRASGQRFNKLCPDGYVYNLEVANNHTYFANNILVHNCHHASAQSYKTILEHFGLLKNKNDWNKECLLIGVTATPQRSDNQGIDQIFDETAFTYGLVEAIQDDWLCDIRGHRIDTATDLNSVHTQAGDFLVSELSNKINNPTRNGLVIKGYQDFVNGKQALVFAADVKHAQDLCKQFQTEGIKAEIITGELPKDKRRTVLEDFAKKKINVLVNVLVLGEGYDCPSIDAILMARPTQSGILFSQMAGRGTRKYEGKPFLSVIDFVDNSSRHTLKTAISLAGIDAKTDLKGKSILEAKQQLEDLQAVLPNINLDNVDLNNLKYFMEEVDLLGGLGRPDEIKAHTQNAWHRFGIGGYRLTLADYHSVIVEPTVTGQYVVYQDAWSPFTKQTTRTVLGECKTVQEAISRSDRYVIQKFPKDLFLVSTNARWRGDKPSEAQLKSLRYRYKVSEQVIQQIDSKGMAADLMNKLNAIKARRQSL